MRLIQAADYTVTPWKNGVGTTTEILSRPAGATLDSFEWRVSMAAVAQDGPFSFFPGIDRTLTLLAGPRLVLGFDGGRLIALTPEDPTIRFAGEDTVNAAVPEGAVSDFNVMTRRSRCRHAFERFALAREATVTRLGSATLLFLAAGDGLVCRADGAGEVTLAERDSIVLEDGDAAGWQLAVAEPVILFRVEIFAGPEVGA